ncbi:MAG: hypothetical protein BMS9Abin34_395 [Patescibacteria group bacterium]|nr:MAG: hypothetical protein BMS9Abin34_395 [Patescibacteria group bacterium]
MHGEFTARVLKVVKTIPKGTTLSYKEVVRLAGSPKAYRAVGNILNRNCDSHVPCHRVIRSDGEVGGFNRGTKIKVRMLREEGTL